MTQKIDDELKCGLANAEDLGGKELAALLEAVRQFVLYCAKVRQPQPV
jgi:hypothetical protein